MQELDDTASWEAPFGKTFVMMLSTGNIMTGFWVAV